MKNHLGVMLDCSRNAVMKPEAVKSFVDIIQKMGYNTLMLYTEDTYEVEGEPLFGYLRGRYTIAELQELDKYCHDKGVELIPCIQTLAHLNQIFKFAHYANVRDCMDVLLVDEEKTYQLLDNMFQSLAKAFSTKRIHIGMDEAHWLGRGSHVDKYGYEPSRELLLRHLDKVVAIAEKYGFQPMIWSDMFLPVYKEVDISVEDKAKVPKQVSLVYWNYYSGDVEKYRTDIDKHLQFDREVWFAGGAWKWHGFHAGNQKTIDMTYPALTACKEKGVANVLMTMWGDDGNECPAVAVLPGLMYAAELYRGNHDMDDIKRKFQEIVGEDWDEFMQLDLPMQGFQKADAYINGGKAMLYSDPFLGFFDLTVKGGEGAAFAKLSEDLAKCKAKNGVYQPVFESMSAYAKLVSVKYELGYWTRKYYLANDKEKLNALLSSYDMVVAFAEEFLDKFEEMWLTYYKPNGFEIQQIRLGGMIARVKGCCARLKKYLCGKIARIEELEEPLVSMDECEYGLPTWSSYKESSTVGVL
jgi:hypothetical protein